MYETITYESILQRMLDRVMARNPNLDTREGSLIFNALAPAAVELQNMYIQLDTILKETFADTASRDYLIKRAAERGITPASATKAILQGEFNLDVPIGSRYSLEDLNYVAMEKISAGIYKMECETAGAVGNAYFGSMIPIDYIDGLTTAVLTKLLIPGEDEEGVESIRKHYFNSLDAQAFGGNVADYKEKVKSLPGVGGVKVYRAWNGGGTVKLVVIDSQFGEPSATVIDTVQTAMDPTQNAGEGLGFAPIGHVVTVAGVNTTTVNVTATLTYDLEWNWADVRPYAEEEVDAYFLELAKTWEDSEELIVRISQIETRFLGLPGVIDVMGTKINNKEENLTLGADNIPVRGDVNG